LRLSIGIDPPVAPSNDGGNEVHSLCSLEHYKRVFLLVSAAGHFISLFGKWIIRVVEKSNLRDSRSTPNRRVSNRGAFFASISGATGVEWDQY
jgi:hypothetical protein